MKVRFQRWQSQNQGVIVRVSNFNGCINVSEKNVSPESGSTLLFEFWRHNTGPGQDRPPCGTKGITSSNCQQMKTQMVHVIHVTQQPLKAILRGTLDVGGALWLAEEMLDGQHQKADTPAHSGVHKASRRKDRKKIASCPRSNQTDSGTNWAELKESPVRGL